MDEKVSVLIPVYNREKFIGACLDSIFAQTYSNIDVIVYDDGSTDSTKDIVRSYPGVILIEGESNRGVSYARNRLMEACNTRYAAWQDSDDIAAPGRIEAQYNKIRETGSALVFCYCVFMKVMESARAEEIKCMGGSMCDLTMVRHFKFNEEIKWGAEDTLWLSVIQHHFGIASLLPYRLYFIRTHNDRISSKKILSSNRKAREASDRIYLQELQKFKK